METKNNLEFKRLSDHLLSMIILFTGKLRIKEKGNNLLESTVSWCRSLYSWVPLDHCQTLYLRYNSN